MSKYKVVRNIILPDGRKAQSVGKARKKELENHLGDNGKFFIVDERDWFEDQDKVIEEFHEVMSA